MLTKRELLEAVKECEESPSNYHDCEKLATFYTIYDHLYPDTSIEQIEEATVGNYGDSEFLTEVSGCDSRQAWGVIDELMNTLKVMQPRLYNAIIVKLEQIK